MKIICLDLETYYDADYTLKKLSTSEYITDPRFRALGLAVVVADLTTMQVQPAKWFTDVAAALTQLRPYIEANGVLAHHCMPGSVEVLTRSGWVRLDALHDGAEIAQWDSSTEEITFTACTPVRSQFSGEMVAWNTTFHKCSYTPNHRMYISTPNRSEWRAVRADVVAEMGMNNVYIPLSGWNRGGTLNVTPEEARLMEAIRADGGVQKVSKAAYVQFKFVKVRKYKRIVQFLRDLDVPFADTYKDEVHIVRTRRCELIDRLVRLLGTDKQYGPWVLDLPQAAQAAVMDELVYWDGSRKQGSKAGFAFATVDPNTAEWVQILAHMNGYRCRGRWSANDRSYANARPIFIAGLRKTTRAKLVTPSLRLAYQAPVFCVTVPSGAFLARSGGTVFITGNSHFDGYILSHHFNLRPKVWFDTLSMARALGLPANVGGSLKNLCIHFDIGSKPDLRPDSSPEELRLRGTWDAWATWELFKRLLPGFPRHELVEIDAIIRQFTEPTIVADVPLLQALHDRLAAEKARMLAELNVTEADMQSGARFIDQLYKRGVEPPMKPSPTNPEAWIAAIAKTDDGMKDLLEHDDPVVQALAAARLQCKSTGDAAKAEKLIRMAQHGPLPVYYNYAGAVTFRPSGGDGVNFMNNRRGGEIRNALMAPDGHVLVVSDLSQIECVVSSTLVLTRDRGYVRIVKILKTDLLWDGVEWVPHDGVVYKGEREVVTHDGITGTPDHVVYTAAGRRVHLGVAKATGAAIAVSARSGQAIRCLDGAESTDPLSRGVCSPLVLLRYMRTRAVSFVQGFMSRRVFKLSRARSREPFIQSSTGESFANAVQRHTGSYQPPRYQPRLSVLPRTRYRQLVFLLRRIHRLGINQSPTSNIQGGRDRPGRQRRSLLPWEHSVIYAVRQRAESVLQRIPQLPEPACVSFGFPSGYSTTVPPRHSTQVRAAGLDRRTDSRTPQVQKKEKVYDILNAGPRHRFTANDRLISNCRITAWLAGQDDLVQAFAEGRDAYCELASVIFDRTITKADTFERFCGKTATLGCSYGTGWKKFQAAVKAQINKEKMPYEPPDEALARRIVDTYRSRYEQIPILWKRCESLLNAPGVQVGPVVSEGDKLLLPNGMRIFYNDLKWEQYKAFDEWKSGFRYQSRKKRVPIYSSKVTENCVQALARILHTDMMARLRKNFKVVMHTYDEIVLCVPEHDADRAKNAMAYEMSHKGSCAWAEGIPLACEVGVGRRYGEAH